MTINYSNPRMSATFHDWPSGSKRVTAQFTIEQVPGRGERACRTTTGATKKLTYASKARIVDGNDGKTYIARLTANYRMIVIKRGDMRFDEEAIFDGDPRYPALLELFK
jgi:hypothetical protein